MTVQATHPQYDAHVLRWQTVRDVVNSDVKKYIKDVDINDPDRNTRYKDDARFTNFTSRTKSGLVGAVFRKPSTIDLPESVEYLELDATGSKLPLDRLAQEVTGEVLQAGRYGLLVDFPASEEGLNEQEKADMNLKARISKYKAESITNWQSTIINGIHTLTLVVLHETVDALGEDGFTWMQMRQFRVLTLTPDGIYEQQLWNDKGEITHRYFPQDFNGNSWEFIPFVFVGAEDNDAEVDSAPLFDLSELNIGHLRNSADYEESVHVTGQPTLFLTTDMSTVEFESQNPNGVVIGARRGHNLGTSGSAQLLQASPNQLADEAMKRKEEQAVMTGARLIMPAGTNETAEAARIKHSGENSMLSVIVNNVEFAINQCIAWTLRFMTKNPETEEWEYKINDKFFDVTLDPQMIMAQLQLFNNGIVASTDVRRNLRETGNLDPSRTDEEIDSDIGDISPIE